MILLNSTARQFHPAWSRSLNSSSSDMAGAFGMRDHLTPLFASCLSQSGLVMIMSFLSFQQALI